MIRRLARRISPPAEMLDLGSPGPAGYLGPSSLVFAGLERRPGAGVCLKMALEIVGWAKAKRAPHPFSIQVFTRDGCAQRSLRPFSHPYVQRNFPPVPAPATFLRFSSPRTTPLRSHHVLKRRHIHCWARMRTTFPPDIRSRNLHAREDRGSHAFFGRSARFFGLGNGFEDQAVGRPARPRNPKVQRPTWSPGIENAAIGGWRGLRRFE